MTTVRFTLLAAGYCTHQAWAVIDDGGFDTLKFPALVGLIEHPRHGVVLFDTGYSRRFFEVTRHFPERLYAMVTPVFFREEDSVAHQLKQRGIAPEDVRTVILSHFHADHVAGAGDFPRARYVYHRSAYERLKPLDALGALRAGHLPKLLPADFEARSLHVEGLETSGFPRDLLPFDHGRDLFGDGSVVLVDLPGHALGHFGVVVNAEPRPVFLVADACWLSRNFRENRQPHAIAQWLFPDPGEYRRTLGKLHQLHRSEADVLIIPSHCSEAWETLVKPAAGMRDAI